MKNIIAGLALGVVFSPAAAFAACPDTQCSTNGPIVPITTTWGVNVVAVAAGAVVTDYRGVQDTCPAWIGIMGCADIGHTAWYMARVK